MIISKNPLVLQIVEGSAGDELLEFLLDRKLAFTDEEYLESMVFVLPKQNFHERALSMLNQIPPSVKENYVQKKDAHPRVAEFILAEALPAGQLNVLAMIIQNPHLPTEFLLRIAAQGQTAALEILLENQVRLIAYPEILEKIEQNPAGNPFIRGKIDELRKFYLQTEAVEAIPENDVLNDPAILDDQNLSPDGQTDLTPIKQKTLTALQRINRMTISQRIQLAITGDKTERLILIKDPNRIVQLAVIESPKMTDDEALLHARNFSVSGEIIGKIASNRDFAKNYTIILALVQNPKTPVSRAVSFIKKLHIHDLKMLVQDRNISPVVRNMALNLQKEKERVKG